MTVLSSSSSKRVPLTVLCVCVAVSDTMEVSEDRYELFVRLEENADREFEDKSVREFATARLLECVSADVGFVCLCIAFDVEVLGEVVEMVVLVAVGTTSLLLARISGLDLLASKFVFRNARLDEVKGAVLKDVGPR